MLFNLKKESIVLIEFFCLLDDLWVRWTVINDRLSLQMIIIDCQVCLREDFLGNKAIGECDKF